jgi:hypothetical protein
MMSKDGFYNLLAVVLVVGVGALLVIQAFNEWRDRNAVREAIAGIDATTALLQAANAQSALGGQCVVKAAGEKIPCEKWFGPFAQRDLTVVCGKRTNNSCMDLISGEVLDPSLTALQRPTEYDRRLCKYYYRYHASTGQADLKIDWHCRERALTPILVPNLER